MEAFEKIIIDTIALFDEFQPLEEEKLKAAQEDNIAAVEDCMNREQAMSLKLRGLDGKREAFQKAQGWEDMNFRQILPLLPKADQGRFQQLLDQLDHKTTLFQSTNESALEIISLHLRDINKAMESKGADSAYGQDGSPAEAERHLTNKRV